MDTHRHELTTVEPEPCCDPGDSCCCGPAPGGKTQVKDVVAMVLIAAAAAVGAYALYMAPSEAPGPATPPAVTQPAVTPPAP